MNDPHVVALFYNIEHSASVVYREAEPREYEAANFSVRIENKKVCFTMKAHYATREEAKEAVREYIDNWEFTAGLRRGSDMFKLVYWNVEIGHHVGAPDPVSLKFTTSLKDSIIIAPYPSPPQSGLKITPDVRSMSDRFAGYRLDREPLASMANFCLTVLQGSAKGRDKAVKMYGIKLAVLSKIGCLCNNKGGEKARKYEGRNDPFTPKEARFLDEAVKAMIHRLAEVADGPVSRLPKIELTDLPQC